MIRFLFPVLIFATVAMAQTPAPAPATRPTPAGSRTLTRDELDALHAQAIALMRDGKYDKAAEALERVYKATPAAQRTRPLVLNRAILDLLQKRFVVRSVRDLGDYLAKHRGEDEFATNVLGACLNAAAGDPRIKSGSVWQTAFKEWDRRNYLLDHSRPGWRRWGTRWVSDEETKAREAKVADLRRAIDDQTDYIDRLLTDAASVAQQQENALNSQSAYNQVRSQIAPVRDYLQQVQRYQAQVATYKQWEATQRAAGKTVPPVNFPPMADPAQTPFNPLNIATLQAREGQLFMNEADAAVSAQQLGNELAALDRQIVASRAQIQKYGAQLNAIRPDWPDRFDPVDAGETAPPPTASAPAGSEKAPTSPVSPALPTTVPSPRAPWKPQSPADLYGQPTTSPSP
jgi:hypothetical protein